MRYFFALAISLFLHAGISYSQTLEEVNDTLLVVSEGSYYADSLKFYDFISPNDDGHNDYFVVDYIQYFPNCQLMIYNVWGDLVYKKTNYRNEFDGHSNTGLVLMGKIVPDGVYYYTLIDTLKRKYSGKITIKR
jgi:gliding motility-associated-like protein